MRFLECTHKLAVIASVAIVSGCAGLHDIPFAKLSNLTPASYTNLDDPVVSGTPIMLYTHIARNIKQCWLKPPNRVLTKHAFFAKASPDDAGGRATITLNELTKDGTKGLTAFKVDFLPLEGVKTNVRIDNFRLPKEMGDKLTRNVRIWSRGKADCDGKPINNDIVSVPPGAKIKPMPVSAKQ